MQACPYLQIWKLIAVQMVLYFFNPKNEYFRNSIRCRFEKIHDLNRSLRQKNTKLEQYLKLYGALIFSEINLILLSSKQVHADSETDYSNIIIAFLSS